MIQPKDLEAHLDTDEERALAKYWGGIPSNIRRALSLVPEEAYAWFQLVETQYLPGLPTNIALSRTRRSN